MHSSLASSLGRTTPFVVTRQRVLEWAQQHYRERTFQKDTRIPARPGLLYLVIQGVVRLAAISPNQTQQPLSEQGEAFLGLAAAGQPFELVAQFELVSQSPFRVQAYAHTENTSVIWLYWKDLNNWPQLYWETLEAFRVQHQRKLMWLSTIGQQQTIDRLLGFITVVVEEHGKPIKQGYYLPFSLTHAQIGSAIGSTRVTVTRLMGKLRQQGKISILGDNKICLMAYPESMSRG